MKKRNEIINWAAISRLLTNNRFQIRADYSGKKYKKRIEKLESLIESWISWIKKMQ